MKAMLLSLLAVALAATAQVHGATVTIDNTTECTLSQYLTSTGKSIATGDDVVFAGSAAVTVTTELSGLTGKITIRDGATLIAANSAALGTADGETWVETGATLKLSSATKAGTVLYDETLHLAGTLRSEEPDSSVPATNCIWPHKWILEGDAQISSAKQRNDFTKIEIDQQGKYLLTIGTCSQYANFSDCTFTNPYRVKVTGYGALNIQGSTVLNGDANCRFIIDDGATIWGYYWGKGENTSLWTLEAKGSAVWAKNWPGVSAQSHDLTWQGPILLEEAALRVASGSHTLALKGKISGAKSLGVPGKESSCNLALYNADNDFTGGINLGANSYLDVEAAGAIPGASDCKPVAMGAGGRVRFCYADTSHPLPDFTISGSGVMHQQYNKTQRIYSGGWRTVTKSGDGELS